MFDKIETATLMVEGMSCGHCQKRVENALDKVKGVKKVTVDLASGRATVTFVPAKVMVAQLVQAVIDAGFTAAVTQ